MDGGKVDRLARVFEKTVSRRWLVALAGVVIGMLRQQLARGSQLGPPTCREQGAVCTLLSGCCNGLTCATSAINTSYGICVPGERGMVSTGTTLISPFSDTAVEEISALVQTASTVPATDLQAERDARIAEIRARKDAKGSKRKTRSETKRSTQQTRKDERRTRQPEVSETEVSAPKPTHVVSTPGPTPKAAALEPTPQVDALGPTLEFQLINPGGSTTGMETLRVRNLDEASVLLAKIESVLHPDDNNATNRTVPPGGSFNYYSGTLEDISDQDEQAWITKLICSGSAGAGFRVTVGAEGDSVNERHVILCDGPSQIRVNEPPAAAPSTSTPTPTPTPTATAPLLTAPAPTPRPKRKSKRKSKRERKSKRDRKSQHRKEKKR
jgi:hypothetical protein